LTPLCQSHSRCSICHKMGSHMLSRSIFASHSALNLIIKFGHQSAYQSLRSERDHGHEQRMDGPSR
jgi:hypothetical protein